MKWLVTAALCAACLAATGAASIGAAQTGAAQTPAAASQHPVLVELFTSEGCSDCPPAEELLAKINGKQTPAGTVIIGIGEHITYYNNAWEDPFSDEEFTDRQKSYVDHLGSEQFAPMAVVMGQSAVDGKDVHAILKAVDATKNTAVSLHILSVKREGKTLAFEYSADGLPKHGAAVIAFLVDDQDSVPVPRGENKHQTLHHVFTVRLMKNLGD
ncbi:MAG: DUF1223 domain-containing protein, partial [Bryocella sp.]